ncbi:hypothetical protein F5Y13DRAFT_186857 [Hypoxylon sp. FL1857]|nr:hypothetical protein F5Y13DRAFT_186857 [Hypoxylon sp. FL1857]
MERYKAKSIQKLKQWIRPLVQGKGHKKQSTSLSGAEGPCSLQNACGCQEPTSSSQNAPRIESSIHPQINPSIPDEDAEGKTSSDSNIVEETIQDTIPYNGEHSIFGNEQERLPQTNRSLRLTLFPGGSTRGLNVIYEPGSESDRPLVDVLFIHGLTGDSFRTWYHSSSGVYWPRDFISKSLPDARVMTFGYDADVTNLFGAVGQGTLQSYAETLVAQLTALRRDEDSGSRRETIIIAHSLGGLVAEKAICMSAQWHDEAYKQLDETVAGIAFIGTPHQGSTIADYASIVTRALTLGSLGLKRINKRILETLRPDSEVLADLQWSFRQWLQKREKDVSIACFFEEHELPVAGIIVPERSAKLEGYLCLPIPNNHSDMPKFEDETNHGYRLLVGELRIWYDRISATKIQTIGLGEGQSTKDDDSAERRHRCAKALSFPEMLSREGTIRKPAVSTCEWLLQHPSYRLWFETGQGILWIIGNPGTGKSTLMKYIVTRMQPIDQLYTLSYYFYNLGTPLQRTREGLLRSLLHQLLDRFPDQMKDLIDEYDKRSKTIAGDWILQTEELMEYLESSLRRVVQHFDVRIYVDALDECKSEEPGEDGTKDIRDLIQRFKDLEMALRGHPHRFSLCFACRPYPNLARPLVDSIINTEKENGNDVEIYLKQQLGRGIEDQDEGIKAALQEYIGHLANGIFQWVKLVTYKAIAMYNAGERRKDIIDEIKTLPRDLSQLYERIITDLPKRRATLSLKLFQWVCLALEPLTITQLRLAMSIVPNSPYRTIDEFKSSPYCVEDDSQMRKLVVELSGGLAEARGKPGQGANQEVSFIHQSVRDYLLESGLSQLEPKLSTIQTVFNAGQNLLMATCLWYLTEQSTMASFNNNFLQYISEEAALKVLERLKNPKETILDWWARRFDNFIPELESATPISQRFEIAVAKTKPENRNYFLTKLCDEAFDNFKVVDGPSSVYHSDGSEEMARFRLESPNTTSLGTSMGDEKPATGPPSHSINFMEMAKIISLFLPGGVMSKTLPGELTRYSCDHWQTHAIVSVQTGSMDALNEALDMFFSRITTLGLLSLQRGGYLLHRAARHHNQVILTELANRDPIKHISINLKERETGKTPLIAAVEEGLLNNVNFLLRQEGIALDYVDDEGKSALMRAARQGHIAIVEELIGRGANLDLQDKEGLSALTYAENDVVAALLLLHGAKTDIADGNRPNILDIFMKRGYLKACEQIIRMFPELTATPDKAFENMLAACSAGQTEILRLFIKYGYKITGTDGPLLHMLLRRDTYQRWKMGFHINSRGDILCDVVRTLITLDESPDGVQVNAIDHRLYTPLMLAITNIHSCQLVDTLLADRRVEVNRQTDAGTALRLSILHGNRPVTKRILDHPDIDPNLSGRNGKSPLHVAVRYEDLDSVKLLLAHPGIDTDVRDASGRTAGEIANLRLKGRQDYTWRIKVEKGEGMIRQEIAALINSHSGGD